MTSRRRQYDDVDAVESWYLGNVTTRDLAANALADIKELVFTKATAMLVRLVVTVTHHAITVQDKICLARGLANLVETLGVPTAMGEAFAGLASQSAGTLGSKYKRERSFDRKNLWFEGESVRRISRSFIKKKTPLHIELFLTLLFSRSTQLKRGQAFIEALWAHFVFTSVCPHHFGCCWSCTWRSRRLHWLNAPISHSRGHASASLIHHPNMRNGIIPWLPTHLLTQPKPMEIRTALAPNSAFCQPFFSAATSPTADRKDCPNALRIFASNAVGWVALVIA